MAQCVAITKNDNRNRGGQQCTRHAVRGSELCFAHGGVRTTSTPEEVEHRTLRNPGVQCNHPNSDGTPCGSYAMKGSTVCVKHGGRVPNTRKAAAVRMMELQLRAIGVVDGMLDDANLEPAIRLRAAQIVLDRTGLGPASKIEHEVEVKPYEQLIAGAQEVVRDVALPPGQSDVIDAEVVEQSSSIVDPPAPAPESEPEQEHPLKPPPPGKPVYDPTGNYEREEPTPEPVEVHNVVSFPRAPWKPR